MYWSTYFVDVFLFWVFNIDLHKYGINYKVFYLSFRKATRKRRSKMSSV